MADLAFRSVSTGADSSFTSATISATLPTGTAQGDGMIIVYDSAFIAGGGAPTHTTPSGWTSVGTGTYNNGTLEGRKTFYARVAGASEGAVTLTSSGNAAHVYSRLSYQNPDPTTFVSSVTPLFGLLASTSSPVFPTITTNGDRQLVIYQMGATLVGGITFEPASSGLTERSDANATCVYELQATTIAAQGTKTISSSAADQFFYGVAVFNPAHTSSGALASAAATIAGTAAHTLLHPSTGALAAAAATIAGTATHLTLHTSTGALAADAATMAGVAAHEHAATGALVSGSATMAGSAAHLTLHTSTGALASADATMAGAAARDHAATGALASAAATMAGSADHTLPGASHSSSGALVASDATMAGAAVHLTLHTTSGGLVADSSAMSGAASHFTLRETTGALQSASATLEGLAQNGEQIVVQPDATGGWPIDAMLHELRRRRAREAERLRALEEEERKREQALTIAKSDTTKAKAKARLERARDDTEKQERLLALLTKELSAAMRSQADDEEEREVVEILSAWM